MTTLLTILTRARVIVLLAIFLCLPAKVFAATKFWKDGVSSGNWNTSTNWSAVSAAGSDNGGAPLAAEPVRIVHTNGTAHSVTLDTDTPSLGQFSIDLTGAGTAANSLLVTNNNLLSAGGIMVGGFSGSAETNGRGSILQTNGTVLTAVGTPIVIGYGAGSTGTYSLGGTGYVVASESLHVGFKGNGTFAQTGGTVTVNASGGGSLLIGSEAGSSGTYNLSGTGLLVSSNTTFVGANGTGVFNQAGVSSHGILGAGSDLQIGWGPTGDGTYTISNSAYLEVANNLILGNSGSGTLIIQDNANVHIGDALNIGAFDTVNMSGGTLRLNSYNKNSFGTFNYTGGKIQLGGDRTLGIDPIIAAIFGASPVIPSGKELAIEGGGFTFVTTSVNVSGGKLSTGGALYLSRSGGITGALSVTNGGTVSANDWVRTDYGSTLIVDGPGSSLTSQYTDISGLNGDGFMTISRGGSVTTSVNGYVGGSIEEGFVTVTGPGSTWTLGNSLSVGGLGPGYVNSAGVLTIQSQALVSVGPNGTTVQTNGIIYLNGGTLRTPDIHFAGNGQLIFNSGTILFTGDRTVGADQLITTYYGTLPVLQAGKGLGIEGTATLLTPLVIDGGTFSAGQIVNYANLTMQRGTLNITNSAMTFLGTTLDVNDDMTVNVTLGITNQGLVTGGGQIGGPFVNGVSGELRASAGKSLKLTGSVNQNFGQVKLLGGELEFTEYLANAPGGLISGNGTIITRLGIFNEGTMNFAGTANIVGDVFNEPGARIISGGGGATVFYDDVRNNGEIRTSTNGFSVFFGAVTGSGTYTGTGTVNFEGDLKPGSSPAAVSFAGDVSFGVDATLEIEIGGLTAGSQHDKLSITGDLSLDGELEVSLINGFNPSAGQSFNILDWGSLSGTFSTLSLPSLSTGLSWNTSQIYTTGVLSVAAVGLPGDYNNNGTVDAGDYVLWRKGGPLANEVDTPGTVNGADYTAWRARFGNTSGSGAGVGLAGTSPSQVPEPNVLLLAVSGCFVGVLRRQRIVCNQ